MGYIKTGEIDKDTLEVIAGIGLDCIREFYASEENQRKFEEWKRQKENAEK